ncbi:MAG: HU family DNA-binding protein [bacterium]|nr:HU family DNA-binding protein [bacterium]
MKKAAAKSTSTPKKPASSAKPLTKSQLVGHLAEKLGLTKKQVNDFFEELAAVGYKESKKGFTLPGFGKLVLVKRKARKGRNPATGETIKIPAKTVVKFRISKACKDAIIGGK